MEQERHVIHIGQVKCIQIARREPHYRTDLERSRCIRDENLTLNLSIYRIQLPAELVGRICMLRLPGSSLALHGKVSDISVDYFSSDTGS